MKKLLLAGFLGLVGAASVSAQVYSVNAVGFVNITVPAGQFKIITNPLNQLTNSLNAILPDVPINTTKVYKYKNGGFLLATKRSTGWTGSAAAENFNPGEAFFVQNAATTNVTLTFVGEVPQGTGLNIPLSAGFNLIAPHVPQAGALERDLLIPAQNNDKVYLFNGTGYALATRRTSTWTGAAIGTSGQPEVAVGEGFWFFNNTSARSWVRDFSVNN